MLQKAFSNDYITKNESFRKVKDVKGMQERVEDKLRFGGHILCFRF